jgi:DNA-directed RNA polymerase subunit RPC12/RpoP
MVKCSTCGAEFDSSLVLFPECPECIRKRMTFPGGIQPRHAAGRATPAGGGRPKSYAAMDGTKIFDFMAYSPGSDPSGSGCELVYAPKHGSYNAICHKPLGQIPGSGIDRTTSGHFPAEFAVLVDVTATKAAGPKFMFEEEANIGNRFTSGEWVRVHMYTKCGKKQSYLPSGLCISCQDELGLL